jgi:asparagine synthase (glutamine-hydrolysing)
MGPDMTPTAVPIHRDPAAGTIRHAVTAPTREPWRRTDLPGTGALWTHGYTNSGAKESPWQRFLDSATDDALIAAARTLPGHGAFILDTGGAALAMTDVAGTVPLYRATLGGVTHIGADGWAVARAAGLDGIDDHAAYQLGLGGYTVGRRTLIPGLETLKPGELLVASPKGNRVLRHSGHANAPDPDIDADDPAARAGVRELVLNTIADMAAGLNGRRIMLPLSGGLDSRAILCALKEAGYGNVVTFSYGLPGNHEAAGAAKVARKLGYPWHMVPYSHGEQRTFFEGGTVRRFWEFADRPDAMPFMQDVPAMEKLRGVLDIPADAVFINGQSGDYNTGNHIPGELLPAALAGLSTAEIRRRIMAAVLAKHFDLWQVLKTPEALARLETDIFADIAESLPGDADAESAFSAYELSEYDNRQVKYVVAGQRSYEFFGYDWRLPLWDREFVEFWLTVPIGAKYRQRLYREALEEGNWGGVWGPEWRFPRTVVPGWLKAPRLAAKLLHAPLGGARWHGFERRYFNWIMDPVLNYAIVPYGSVARDRRGHRNALAWHAEAFLKRHGLSLESVA